MKAVSLPKLKVAEENDIISERGGDRVATIDTLGGVVIGLMIGSEPLINPGSTFSEVEASKTDEGIRVAAYNDSDEVVVSVLVGSARLRRLQPVYGYEPVYRGQADSEDV